MNQENITLADIIAIMGWAASLVIRVLFLMFLQDILQPHSAIRRNFPIVGGMRYFLEKQGEFFSQCFFSHAREEMPFNRATCSYVYKIAKNIKPVLDFGILCRSTVSIRGVICLSVFFAVASEK